MITKIRIKNFKLFENIEIEFDDIVVFTGGNNSGKSTVLQAILLWKITVDNFLNKSPQATSIKIGKDDIFQIQILELKDLWNNTTTSDEEYYKNKNIEIALFINDKEYNIKFSYDTEFALSCEREFLFSDDKNIKDLNIKFLNSVTGTVKNEKILPANKVSVEVPIVQNRSQDVIRNLCYQIIIFDKTNKTNNWGKIVEYIKKLFGVELLEPKPAGNELRLYYKENNSKLELLYAGTGLLQTLFLIASFYYNPNSVLLLDEPEVHFEKLRISQLWTIIEDFKENNNLSQIIIVTHSSTLSHFAVPNLQAVINKKIIRLRSRNIKDVLTKYSSEHFFRAYEFKSILYIEGSTDLRILKKFAKTLKHKAHQRRCTFSPFHRRIHRIWLLLPAS